MLPAYREQAGSKLQLSESRESGARNEKPKVESGAGASRIRAAEQQRIRAAENQGLRLGRSPAWVSWMDGQIPSQPASQPASIYTPSKSKSKHRERSERQAKISVYGSVSCLFVFV